MSDRCFDLAVSIIVIDESGLALLHARIATSLRPDIVRVDKSSVRWWWRARLAAGLINRSAINRDDYVGRGNYIGRESSRTDV